MVKPSACVSVDSLVDLACRNGVDVRPTLVRALTDLYVQRPAHSAEEENQYVELVVGLIESVDARTRAAVAAKLRRYPKAPAAVLRKLDSLLTPEPAANQTGEDLVELFFSSGPEERRLVLTNLDIVSQPGSRRPISPEGELIRRLENAALKRDPAEFSRVLARALNISRSLAERIAHDNSGEPVVVAGKALGMKIEVLQRILLFLNPVIGQSVQQIFELCRLYSELTPAAAEQMLTIWQSSATRPASLHEPVYWNDERRHPRSFETQTPDHTGAKHSVEYSRTKISKR